LSSVLYGCHPLCFCEVLREVALGAEVEMPELTREGYVFLGWYYGDTKLESGIWTIEEDVVLTPRWEPIS
jgi:uncharacterized repeat protein (TIGR02543 family)